MKTLYDYFNELEIAYTLFDHEPFYTCDDSDPWYEQHIGSDTGKSKNLFLRNRKGNTHYLVAIESSKQLDLKVLAASLEEKQLSFASEDRLMRFLNLKPGSVSPLALIFEGAKDVKLVIDQDLLSYQNLNYHPPARNDQTVMLAKDDLLKFLSVIDHEPLILPL